MAKMLNFKATDEEAARIKRAATSIPYRTLSQYMREVILADVERVERDSSKEAAAK